MSLLSQRPTKKVRSAAGSDANQVDSQGRREVQQLSARTSLAHHNLTTRVPTNHMKYRLAEINANRL
jgi:hypothetical protein